MFVDDSTVDLVSPVLPIKRLLVATALALFCALPASPADKHLVGWVVTQKSKLCGEMKVYLTKDAVKAFDAKTSTVLVSKAPDWKVLIFNTSSKTIYTSSFDRFKGYDRIDRQVMIGFKFGGLPLEKKPGTDSVVGQKVNIYGTSAKTEKSYHERYLKGEITGGSARRARLLVSSNWPVPPQPGVILSQLYGIAPTSGIPLQFECENQEGKKKLNLETRSIKNVAIEARQFDCPSGYRRVANIESVHIDAGGQTAMEEMLMGLDEHIDQHTDKNGKNK
jgi:hypothetical protein